MKEGIWNMYKVDYKDYPLKKLETKFNKKSIIVHFRVACEFYRINHISG